ncbi:MAG: tetratricopeptide repeat protein, partial [Pseudomonadota bacterium]|nr:tetratricopeptide repeat protein [Pseudomonadota bacterium]MEC9286106.1 tetratricopeptide repeat protein [Pseudomonadota bacterium]
MSTVRALRLLFIGGLIYLATECDQPHAYSKNDAELNDRGVAQMGRFEYEDAHATFTAVVDAAPTWLDVRVNLAIATLNRQREGDETLALRTLEGVLKIEPRHQRALYTSGLIHLYLGHTDQAIPLLREVMTVDPNDAYTAYFLGQSLLQAGKYV